MVYCCRRDCFLNFNDLLTPSFVSSNARTAWGKRPGHCLGFSRTVFVLNRFSALKSLSEMLYAVDFAIRDTSYSIHSVIMYCNPPLLIGW